MKRVVGRAIVSINANYTTANAWADIAPATGPSLLLVCPKRKRYIISWSGTFASQSGERSLARLTINKIGIPYSERYSGHDVAADGLHFMSSEVHVTIEAGNVISTQAMYTAGSTILIGSVGTSVSSLSISEAD